MSNPENIENGGRGAEPEADPLIRENELIDIMTKLSDEHESLKQLPHWAVPRSVDIPQLRRRVKSFDERNPTLWFSYAFALFGIECLMSAIDEKRGEAHMVSPSVARQVLIERPPGDEDLGDGDELGEDTMKRLVEELKAFEQLPHSAVPWSVVIPNVRRRLRSFKARNPTLRFDDALWLFLIEQIMNEMEKRSGKSAAEAQKKRRPVVRRARNRRLGCDCRRWRGRRWFRALLCSPKPRRGNPCS